MLKYIMNNNLDVYNNQYNDEEIDLYEIIELLIKNKWMIIVTTFLVTLISLGVALYFRANTNDYLEQRVIIKNYDYDLKGINEINPDVVFLKNSNLDSFFKQEELNKFYFEEIPLEKRTQLSKREFLQEIIKISKDAKNKNMITITTEVFNTEKTSKELIRIYIELLNKQSNLVEIVKNNKTTIEEKIMSLNEEMKKLDQELSVKIEKETDKNGEVGVELIQIKYPELIERLEGAKNTLSKYREDLIKLDEVQLNLKNVEKTTDVYLVEGKSKAKLILAVGIVFGGVLGIMLVFLKEFVNGYKKRYMKG